MKTTISGTIYQTGEGFAPIDQELLQGIHEFLLGDVRIADGLRVVVDGETATFHWGEEVQVSDNGNVNYFGGRVGQMTEGGRLNASVPEYGNVTLVGSPE